MILGMQLAFVDLIYTGVLTLAVLVLQMLVGTRVIRFKGRTHAKVHRYLAWALSAVAVIHGLLAFAVFGGWRILS